MLGLSDMSAGYRSGSAVEWLLLPPAPASCSCLLLLPPAPASCLLLLPPAPASCSCLLPPLGAKLRGVIPIGLEQETLDRTIGASVYNQSELKKQSQYLKVVPRFNPLREEFRLSRAGETDVPDQRD